LINILVKCQSTTCKNNGTCNVINENVECTCAEGFKGKFCEFNNSDLKDISNSAVNTLSNLNSTIDGDTEKALDDLKLAINTDNKILTQEVSKFIVDFSSNVNNKVENNKIAIVKAIYKIYDLGMGTSL